MEKKFLEIIKSTSLPALSAEKIAIMQREFIKWLLLKSNDYFTLCKGKDYSFWFENNSDHYGLNEVFDFWFDNIYKP
jgi:hypothetical protein